ncbi:NADPH:quinone reductase [Mangrovihabitans endophyticus]|uniref:Putative oxidoreductase n=1 Tax=Mangrovihabitans endophyticus TaxID=1751298 RepID=A0A8J3FMK9_9ACTN|nr:NADPH:quinone reductase [Mangrovihabitans endophyticus]GGK73951.1 putative oxidoreductase [Mangrovihabitans endophyticus]
MEAAFVERLGPPGEIRVGAVRTPRPGPGEVLIDVLATTVNPVDTLVRSGLFRTPIDFPFVIGRDLVGAVAQSRVAAYAPGDRVWCNSLGHDGRQGAAAQRAVVAADRVYRLPPGVDPIDAVAVVHPAATAYLALFTHGELRAGETVLVMGAAGNVGSALVTLAADAGATVIATAAPRDAGYCRSLGASAVLDYAAPPRVPADLIVDTSGGNDLATATGLLRRRGRIVLLAGVRTRPVLPAGELYLKDGSVRGFVISHATSAELAEAAATINRLLAAGGLRARTVERLPLGAAAETHRRMECGELHGRRVVLVPPGPGTRHDGTAG